jgi:hypothetical protein
MGQAVPPGMGGSLPPKKPGEAGKDGKDAKKDEKKKW